MQFYQASAGIFPRSYLLRIFAICFAALHLPLVVLVLLHSGGPQFAAILTATVAGGALALLALRGLLEPVQVAAIHLERLHEGEPAAAVPQGAPDVAGRLLRAVGQLTHGDQLRMDRTRGVAAADPLTGLCNPRGFKEAVLKSLPLSGGGVLALIDGDNFKLVNDRLGREQGDKVLCGLARRIEDNIRGGDIAGRWGDDEFVIFFPGLGEEGAKAVIDRLHEALMLNPDAEIDGKPVAFSYGIAPLGADEGEQIEEAVANADRSLYAVKRRKWAA